MPLSTSPPPITKNSPSTHFICQDCTDCRLHHTGYNSTKHWLCRTYSTYSSWTQKVTWRELFINETALEEAAVFLSQSNSIGGLCWTHSPLVDVALNNYHSALNISHALTAGKVHLGKEVSVVGAHLFGEDMFYPILAAPTCKLESSEDMEFIFKTTIAA